MLKPTQLLFVALLASIFLVLAAAAAAVSEVKGTTYDGRSLMISGRRELLFSGSVHYPRCPREMWGDILQKAKRGGLNMIQTYVFWNVHEPVQGQYNFNGNYDLVKFIKMIGEHRMYATLRVGPFIEAEWNYGGFPYWLREVSNITFRTDSPPFMYHMKKFTKVIIKMMKNERLFASQGGPIVLSQIENEYTTVQNAFGEHGTRYIQWAGTMAVGLQTGIPWVMCKQQDAPDSVINTCNGRNCGDTFPGPNNPHKPSLWTENWTTQYSVFGDPPSQRSAEDIAFSVARFFSKNGTLANYYMYYGGTNFGRTSSSFVTTRYYDEAPIDEYGLLREPKWGHIRDLHSALRLCKKALLWGTPSVQTFGQGLEARVYDNPEYNSCCAFLTNNNTRFAKRITFRGVEYYLPRHSISILVDCKIVVYNTNMIVAQHSSRSYKKSEIANKNLQWELSREKVPTPADASLKSRSPLELMSSTKDTTDYLWYTTTIELDHADLPYRKDIVPVLQVANRGHVMHVFVNGEFVGSGHGNNVKKSFVIQKAVDFKPGVNNISLLGATVGFPDSGAYLEHRSAGVHLVTIKGLNMGTLDLSLNGWAHKVGLDGEKLDVYTQGGCHRVQWTKAPGLRLPMTWYKAHFNAPGGNDPVAIDLGTMSKGMVWVNGKSIGRYWSSFLSPLGKPSQDVYHIPRAFLKPTDNLIVALEEIGGNPEGIQILTVNRDVLCSFVGENFPVQVKSWQSKGGLIQTAAADLRPSAQLQCPEQKKIVQVEFASYGNPFGACGDYSVGNCSAANSQKVVEQNCLGKNKCSITMDQKKFDKDGKLCSGTSKMLAVQVRCGGDNDKTSQNRNEKH